MRLSIAIQPDDYTSPSAPDRCDASSPRWAEGIQRAGHVVKWVDVRREDILEQVRNCQGFMWRWAHFGGMCRVARRLLPVLEKEMGLVVYPDQNTCWHYDDKIAQAYLLQAAGIPVPKTWIWFDADAARPWATGTRYPLVLKLSTGAGSSNVRMIHNAKEAIRWIDRLFCFRLTSLDERQFQPWRSRALAGAVARTLLHGSGAALADDGYDPQSGYAFFQEFLPDNAFDTRVTVIGKRAFAYRRFNRPGDFRASGSGQIDWDAKAVDLRAVRLAFQVCSLMRMQSCAIDALRSGDQPVVGEISYTYASWAVRACPGHWELQGPPTTGDLVWREGPLWPEEAQIADFLDRLESRFGSRIG